MVALTVCTWNVGDGSAADLRGLMDRYDVIGLQEMGDRDGLYDCCTDYGWKIFDGDGKDGKRATPLAYNPDAVVWKENIVEKLSNAQHVNPGTGPEDIKTKWAIGCRFHVKGYDHAVRIVTCHLVADSGSGERRELAQKQVKVLAGLYPEADGVVVIAGDLNTSWDNGLTKPLKNAGWTSNHACKGGPVKTHGGWTPDHIWTRQTGLNSQGAIGTGSDHKALWADYTLKG